MRVPAKMLSQSLQTVEKNEGCFRTEKGVNDVSETLFTKSSETF